MCIVEFDWVIVLPLGVLSKRYLLEFGQLLSFPGLYLPVEPDVQVKTQEQMTGWL